MKRLELWLPLGLVLTLGLLLGMLGFSIWEKIPNPLERVIWSQQAQWIAPQTPTYRFYARNTFYLPDDAKAGWLRLSADNDFILYVNGKQVTRENTVSNTSHGLGAGLTMPFQHFNDSNSYAVNNAIGSFLLASSQDWKLTAYVDLISYLHPGKNVIGLEIQKGQTNPRVVVEGAVYPIADVNPIILTTGASSWRMGNLSETHQSLQWFDVDFPDVNWSEAKVLGSVKEATYSRLNKSLFERSLQGNWITGNQSSQGEVWLTGVWQIPQTQIAHAYIRFAGNSEYSLLLNGALLQHYKVEDSKKLHLLEVTKLLQPDNNIFAVRLAHPLETGLTNGSVDFFLDGWTETEKGEIIGAIATDNTWKTLNELVPSWAEGAGSGKPVTLLGLPQMQEFRRSFEGNAYLLNYPNYLWHQSLWQLGGIAFALVYASILGFWLKRRDSWWDSLSAGAAILSPGTLFLIGIGLLKHRYAEAEIGLLFAQPKSNYLILLGFVSIILVTLLLSQIKSRLGTLPYWILWFLCGVVAIAGLGFLVGGNVFLILLVIGGIIALTSNLRFLIFDFKTRVFRNWLTPGWQSWGQWLLLVLIISVGFGLRVYHLDFLDLDTDENTSLDATRGILRTGAPIATSGIWYTRGPFYHYLLAVWLRLVGDSIVNARLLSALWGTATLVLVYILAHKVTGKVWIALLVTAILAIDPWHLWYSRFIRFYPVLQFVTILCFWSFLKGFIERAGRCYQYIFFIGLTISLLTQEINLTILPVFLIGFLYFYRPFNLFNDWQIVLGCIMTLVIFVYNLGFAAIKLLNPLPALSDATASYLRLHFSDVTNLFAVFLIGSDRMRIIYTLFFFAGFIYFIRQGRSKIIFLYSSVLLNLLLVTVLAYDLAERYVYGIYPLFILLSIYGGIAITKSLGIKLQFLLNHLLPLKAISLTCILLLLLANIQPERVLASYQESLNRHNTELFDYIRIHRKPGDVVISSVSSFPPISSVKLDYFLFTPLKKENFDATYWRDGRLIDRWGGGVVLNNTDQLNRILEKSQRVWIHVDDVRHSRVTPELRHYVEILGKPVFETFGTRLRLWQPEDGLPSRIRNEGKDLGAY
jgi:4-amino-4-deoxy-L-arabinose transferase-like glycosyltransferase